MYNILISYKNGWLEQLKHVHFTCLLNFSFNFCSSIGAIVMAERSSRDRPRPEEGSQERLNERILYPCKKMQAWNYKISRHCYSTCSEVRAM